MNRTVTIGPEAARFEWREWDARALGMPDEWTHPGLAVSASGAIVVPDQTTRELVWLDSNGAETRRVAVRAACAHGLTVTPADHVWIADTGVRVRVEAGEVVQEETPGAVFSVDTEGQTTMELARPDQPNYRVGRYVPTSVATTQGVPGGDDTWVADGYGMSLVHRYAAGGEHRLTLDGEEGGGRFDGSHAVFVDTRGPEPRLLVTDRSNHRVAVYDLEGTFVKLLGAGELRMPSAFAVAGELLYVAELWSRMAVYDPDDRVVGYLGDGEAAWEEDAWPNQREDEGVSRRPVHAGRFNAPHGLGAGPDGTLYVAEWSLGGRLVALAPAGG